MPFVDIERGVNLSQSELCGGDSGGPALRRFNGAEKIVGVNSSTIISFEEATFFQDKKILGLESVMSRTDVEFDWIQQIIANPSNIPRPQIVQAEISFSDLIDQFELNLILDSMGTGHLIQVIDQDKRIVSETYSFDSDSFMTIPAQYENSLLTLIVENEESGARTKQTIQVGSTNRSISPGGYSELSGCQKSKDKNPLWLCILFLFSLFSLFSTYRRKKQLT